MCMFQFSFALEDSSLASFELPLQLASAAVGWWDCGVVLLFKAESCTLIWFLA